MFNNHRFLSIVFSIALAAGLLISAACLSSCRHKRPTHAVAEQVAVGAPIMVYYCDQSSVRLWLKDKLDFGTLKGQRLSKKEAKVVRSCIQAIRTTNSPWPASPADAATCNRYLFVSDGRVVFSIFHGKDLLQYPLSQTNPALWAKSYKVLARKLKEAKSSPLAP